MKLTGKQERFVRLIFEGRPQRAAYVEAGYSAKNLAQVDHNASVLADNSKVLSRLAELKKAAEDASVATVLERKQVLTEIVRGRFADFMTNLTTEKLKSAALQEIRITEGEGGKTTTIKLHSPIQAIAELNKMEKIYSETTINIDNRKVEAKFVQFDSREIARAIVEGIRLGFNPEVVSGDGHGEDTALLSTPTDIQATSVPKPED